MDYARKIGKPKETLKTRSNICFNLKQPASSSLSLTEDNKLSNWKKWLADRKKHYQAYKKILGRNENELVLNSGEKYRSVVETRDLMEYASDPAIEAILTKNIDLNFWITPEVLPNHGNPNLPEIEVPTNRKFTLNQEFVHVASPDLILEEKGLSKIPELRRDYLEEKMEKCANILSILEPNPPKMEKLFIRGKNLKKCDKKERKKVPVITITSAEEFERETSEWSINPDAMIAALKIQDTEIVRRLNPKFREKTGIKNNCANNWEIKFDCKVDEILEKMIIFENRGNMKIFFKWRLVWYEPENFPPRRREISSFFFNKNNGFILPGQILQFPVWFKSGKSGMKEENWRFVTDPILSCEDIIFRFWGCCVEDVEKENIHESKVQEIEKYLDNRIRDSAILEILEEIFNNILTLRSPDSHYEDYLSESDSITNPPYFDNSYLIKEFREVYDNICNSDDTKWNFSSLDLQNLLLEIENSTLWDENSSRFVNICNAALIPVIDSSTKNEKYDIIYNLLCSFVNRFEDESESVKTSCYCYRIETIQSGSNRLSRTSSGKTTPKSKIKPKRNSKKGNLIQEERIKKEMITKTSDVILYTEFFFSRIYEIFGETISKACDIIDSFVKLDECEN